jgi:predicted DNA-binding transcriptional regulator AlpA
MNTEAFPRTGLVKLGAILRFLSISKTMWYVGVRSARYPKTIKLGPRTSCWRAEAVWNLVDNPPADFTPAVLPTRRKKPGGNSGGSSKIET